MKCENVEEREESATAAQPCYMGEISASLRLGMNLPGFEWILALPQTGAGGRAEILPGLCNLAYAGRGPEAANCFYLER